MLHIKKGYIQPVDNNKRYKLITSENKYYILDLDSNKFSLILPFINYITPRKVMEIEYQTAKNLMESQDTNRETFGKYFWLISGTSIFFSVLLRPLVNNTDLNINIYMIILLLILTNLPIVLLRFFNSHKEKKVFMKTKYISVKRVFIIPKLRIIFLSLSCYLFFGFCYFLILYGFLLKEKPNILISIISMLMLYLFLQSNRVLYSHQHAKIYLK
ncbi:DUF443 family protein [Staphylococcus caeli]|uniref:Tandem five-TM protein n=1 Tax=Staphylococcus caeli TaxID=2201815 RepID=A0A1D4JXD7_9STAP|nr:tandem five-TM protein [Staphylococcus caeli]SCS86561.1 tandem five-TM protein [Staphylococcus caeli]